MTFFLVCVCLCVLPPMYPGLDTGILNKPTNEKKYSKKMAESFPNFMQDIKL